MAFYPCTGVGESIPVIAPDYDTTVTYNKEDVVLYNGTTYMCNADGATGTWNSTYWDVVYLADLTKYDPDLGGKGISFVYNWRAVEHSVGDNLYGYMTFTNNGWKKLTIKGGTVSMNATSVRFRAILDNLIVLDKNGKPCISSGDTFTYDISNITTIGVGIYCTSQTGGTFYCNDLVVTFE